MAVDIMHIDFECSRQFDDATLNPRIQGHRATEIPPEYERGETSDPYKADVWALAVLILRALQLTGFHVPELLQLIRPMLHDNPDRRPTASMVQGAFDSMIPRIDESRLRGVYQSLISVALRLDVLQFDI